MKDWLAPKSIKELQQFLGFSNNFKRFIWSFDCIALLISKLLNQQQLCIWGTEQ